MSQVEIVLKAGAGYSESSLADADVSVKMNNLASSATVNLATLHGKRRRQRAQPYTI